MSKKISLAVLVVAAACIIILGGTAKSMAMSYDFDQMWSPLHSSVLTLSFNLGEGVNFWVWNGDEDNFKGFRLLGPGFGFAVFTVTPSGDGYVVSRGSQSFVVDNAEFSFAFLDNDMQALSPAAYQAVKAADDADTYTVTFSYNNRVSTVDVQDAAPVPIPAAVWLFGSGMVGLVCLRRR